MGVIITTTNKISCHTVKKYKGMICANQVVGANVIDDIFASWTDFFGGNSGAYRDRLDELFSDVKNQLIVRAEELGANAILGLRFSFNEISGKDKSMLMLSGYGTSAIVEPDNIERLEKIHKLNTFLTEGIISEEQYNDEKNKLLSLYDKIVFEGFEYSDAELEENEDQQNETEDTQEIEGLGNLWKMSIDGIIKAKVPFKLNGRTNEEVLNNLLKDELYNEAGKFYIQYAKVDAATAYDYILSICLE